MSTILCLASELKGLPFLLEAKRQGCHVVVLMNSKLLTAAWPWAAIDEHFDMPDIRHQPDVTNAVSYLARERAFDRVVALDDYDVETAAALREHFRLDGMGDSAARLFRDKLAMRVHARDQGLRVPAFCGLFHDVLVNDFIEQIPSPWMYKPRTLAGSEGIVQVHHREHLWHVLNEAGDARSHHLLEQFVAGDVFHVDALSWQGEIVFSLVSKYGKPPMEALQGRGIFTTQVLPREHRDAKSLAGLHQQLISVMGRDYGPTHTEFIKAEDGQFYFLETSARVGGGNIEKLIEAATGLNMWQEAARMELADLWQQDYQLPELREAYSGLIACPASSPETSTTAYTDPEIIFRSSDGEFVSLIVGADSAQRVDEILSDYSRRFAQDFLA